MPHVISTSGLQMVPPSQGGSINFTPDAGYSIGGTGANGSGLTVNGPAFGSKANGAKHLYVFPLLSSLNPDQNVSRTTTGLSPDSTAVIQSSIVPANTVGAARVRACSSARQIPPPIIFQAPWVVPGVNTYVFRKLYYGHGSDPSQPNSAVVKMIRIFPNAGPGNQPDLFMGDGSGTASDNTGSFSPATDIEGPSPISSGSTFCGLAQFVNTWITDEFIYTCSSVGNVDGDWNCYRNGILSYPTTQKWQMQSSGLLGPQTKGFFNEYSAGAQESNPPMDAFDYYCKIIVDDSFCRLFISTESSFNTAVLTGPSFFRELFYVTSWSNTQLQAQIDYGQYASLSGLYLWWSNSAYSATRIGKFN